MLNFSVQVKTEEIATSEEPSVYFQNILSESQSVVHMIMLSVNGNNYLLQDPLLALSFYREKIFLYFNKELRSWDQSPFDALGLILKKIDGQKLFGFFSYEFLEFIEPQIVFNNIDLYKMPRFLGLFFSQIWQLAPDKSGGCRGQKIQISIWDEKKKEIPSINLKNLQGIEKIFQSADSSLCPDWHPLSNGIESLWEKESYLKKISELRGCIKKGEFYQANLTCLFSRKQEKSLRKDFFELFSHNPTNYFCFLQTPFWEILSGSPECFLFTEKGFVQAQPIKGTTPYTEDKSSLYELLKSAKNAAELNMITDLMRNDLQKVSEIGSVKVLASKDVIEMKNVFHLCSQVRGKLKRNVESIDLIKAAFPSGSITGCPKLKSVEWLKRNEVYQRGVYTGAMGWLSEKELHLNVAIRTMIHRHDRTYFQVGGGITWDSDPSEEWEEILAKAKPFLEMD